ncbi:unnamed protein product [Miscanthus lutarioriparius]|uniref:Uncharacterized protein n=1 Tax=Miscanthus lutarioriparius TaxID=422564 RepID=A0A811RL27_9POAL|nr:unnamed protein product [Miscanthus lutarioriparius]
MASGGAYPVLVLHLPGGGGGDGGHWSNLGAAYAAVTFLRPQGQSLVLYAAGPDADGQQCQQQPRPRGRIVLVYLILPGDAFERLDGASFFVVGGARVRRRVRALLRRRGRVRRRLRGHLRLPVVDDGEPRRGGRCRWHRGEATGLRVAMEEAPPAPDGADIAARLAQLSIGR